MASMSWWKGCSASFQSAAINVCIIIIAIVYSLDRSRVLNWKHCSYNRGGFGVVEIIVNDFLNKVVEADRFQTLGRQQAAYPAPQAVSKINFFLPASATPFVYFSHKM